MAVSLSVSTWNLSELCGIAGLVITSIFALCVTYDVVLKLAMNCRKNKNDASSDCEPGQNTTLDLQTLISAFLTLSFGTLCVITFTLLTVSLHSPSQTSFLVTVSFCAFHLSRCAFHSVFVRRTQIIYGDTVFALTRYRVLALCVCIVVYALTVPYTLFTRNRDIVDGHISLAVSAKSAETVICASSALHIAMMAYSLFLLLSPLRLLMRHQNDRRTVTADKLSHVVSKYTVLCSCSILSAVVLIITASLSSQPLILICTLMDCFVSALCVVLLDPVHNRIYRVSCCCLHRMCLSVCTIRTPTAQMTKVRSETTLGRTSTTVDTTHATETRKDGEFDERDGEQPITTEVKIDIRETIQRKISQRTQGSLCDVKSVSVASPSSNALPPPTDKSKPATLDISVSRSKDASEQHKEIRLCLDAFKNSSFLTYSGEPRESTISNTLRFINCESTRL